VLSGPLGPLITAALLALAIIIVFVGVWRTVRTSDPIEARLAQYGSAAKVSAAAPERDAVAPQRRLPLLVGSRGSISFRLADLLTRADVSLTAAEFVLMVFGLAALGFLAGSGRGGVPFGALVGGVLAVMPFIYLRSRANRRRQAFTNQLPDVLTLLIGALRAGFGVTQAVDMLVTRLPKPSSTEFERARRAVSLGLPITRALNDMADRVGSDDLYLVVTAMSVQQELGGNLAQILETIEETIRERIRIKREIRVLTAQQRLTGMILALLPVAAVLIIGTINRQYMSMLFTTAIGRTMVVVALVLELLGLLVIRRIVDIEV
jgi:tight adherence protein B